MLKKYRFNTFFVVFLVTSYDIHLLFVLCGGAASLGTPCILVYSDLRDKMVVCTKLVQWLTIAAVFMEVWYGLVVGWIPVNISPQMYQVLLPVRQHL